MRLFESFVALRLLRGVKRQKGFLSLSTFISTAGIAVGVMALLVVIGVMAGFTQELKKKILSVNAHIMVLKHGASMSDYRQAAAKVKAVPGVVSASPFIYTQVMYSAFGNMSGGVIRGLDLETISRGGPKALNCEHGKFADLAGGAPGEPPRTARSSTARLPVRLMSGCVFTTSGTRRQEPICCSAMSTNVRSARAGSGIGLG